MSNFKGTDYIFPLKDIRVRGDFRESEEMIKNNLSQINKQMLTLREHFGTKIYDRHGNKIFLDLWQVGRQQNNTAPQLRWVMTVGEQAQIKKRKKIAFTVSLYDIISCEKNNADKVIELLANVKHLPVYRQIIDADIKRVQLNGRNKASVKMLQHLVEVEQSFMIETIYETTPEKQVTGNLFS